MKNPNQKKKKKLLLSLLRPSGERKRGLPRRRHLRSRFSSSSLLFAPRQLLKCRDGSCERITFVSPIDVERRDLLILLFSCIPSKMMIKSATAFLFFFRNEYPMDNLRSTDSYYVMGAVSRAISTFVGYAGAQSRGRCQMKERWGERGKQMQKWNLKK